MEKDHSITFLKQYWLILLLAGLGLICLCVGLYQFQSPKEPVVIATDTSRTQDKGTIVIDVAGAVAQPGVYFMPADARVQDVLDEAGGITEEADHAYVAKVMNKAQVLQDGQKIYVPFRGQETGEVAGEAESTLVNINTASAKALEDLPAIGKVTADKIISNRPYQAIEDLLSKDVVSQKTFDTVKDLISVY